jgi:adenylate cyclase
MAIEIERKFLVFRDRLPALDGYPSKVLEQAYLAAAPAIRVRRKNDGTASITVKGWGTLKRPEFAYGIPLEDFDEIAKMSPWSRILKRRYRIPNGTAPDWELDVFTDRNEWLIVAEIEFDGVEVPLNRPPWLAAEMTEDPRFQNVCLAQRPFTTWKKHWRDAVLRGVMPPPL